MSSEDSTATDEGAERLSRRLVFGAAAFALAALLVAGFFGISWAASAAGEGADLAQQREDVTRVTTAGTRALTEMNFNAPDDFFTNVAQVATKEFADQSAAGKDALKKAMVDQKLVVGTTVHDVAVVELDQRQGKAKAMAAIEVNVKQGDKPPFPKSMRLNVELQRAGDDAWKVANLEAAPVVGAGGGK